MIFKKKPADPGENNEDPPRLHHKFPLPQEDWDVVFETKDLLEYIVSKLQHEIRPELDKIDDYYTEVRKISNCIAAAVDSLDILNAADHGRINLNGHPIVTYSEDWAAYHMVDAHNTIVRMLDAGVKTGKFSKDSSLAYELQRIDNALFRHIYKLYNKAQNAAEHINTLIQAIVDDANERDKNVN